MAFYLGTALFFMAGVTPTVSRVLPPKERGPFLRPLFTVFYCFLFAALSCFLAAEIWEQAAPILLGTVFIVYFLQLALRKIYQNLKKKEGPGGASARRIHRVSVILSLLNLGLAIYYVSAANAVYRNTPS